jgi:hypothetical protein
MTAVNQMNGLKNQRGLITRESVSSSFTVPSDTLWRYNKAQIGQLTQMARINCRRPVRTALAEQEQHYSIPAPAVPP